MREGEEGAIGSSQLIYTFLDAHLATFPPPRREGCRKHLWQVSRGEAARRQLLMGINRARWDGFSAGGAKDGDVNTNAVMNVEGVGGRRREGRKAVPGKDAPERRRERQRRRSP